MGRPSSAHLLRQAKARALLEGPPCSCSAPSRRRPLLLPLWLLASPAAGRLPALAPRQRAPPCSGCCHGRCRGRAARGVGRPGGGVRRRPAERRRVRVRLPGDVRAARLLVTSVQAHRADAVPSDGGQGVEGPRAARVRVWARLGAGVPALLVALLVALAPPPLAHAPHHGRRVRVAPKGHELVQGPLHVAGPGVVVRPPPGVLRAVQVVARGRRRRRLGVGRVVWAGLDVLIGYSILSERTLR
jgi:hypothetical protein